MAYLHRNNVNIKLWCIWLRLVSFLVLAFWWWHCIKISSWNNGGLSVAINRVYSLNYEKWLVISLSHALNDRNRMKIFIFTSLCSPYTHISVIPTELPLTTDFFVHEPLSGTTIRPHIASAAWRVSSFWMKKSTYSFAIRLNLSGCYFQGMKKKVYGSTCTIYVDLETTVMEKDKSKKCIFV